MAVRYLVDWESNFLLEFVRGRTTIELNINIVDRQFRPYNPVMGWDTLLTQIQNVIGDVHRTGTVKIYIAQESLKDIFQNPNGPQINCQITGTISHDIEIDITRRLAFEFYPNAKNINNYFRQLPDESLPTF